MCMFLGASLLSSGFFTMTPHPTPEWRSRQWGDQESGNFGLWNGEIQLKESGIPLTIVIQNPSSTDKESEIQVFTDKKAGIQYLE